MGFCNVRNRNVQIANSISHHTKLLSVGKSDCSCDVSKPVIRESVVVNISNSARKRSFNVSSHKNGVTKSLNVRSILMASIYFYRLVLLFLIFHQNFWNDNVDNFFKGYVTRSDRWYAFSFYFCKYSFFIYSTFNDLFYVNNITNIFDNNLYIKGLLNSDNKFLYCNCEVTGENITSFQQESKFKVYNIFITLKNNSVFLIIIFVMVMLFLYFLVFNSFFKIPN